MLAPTLALLLAVAARAGSSGSAQAGPDAVVLYPHAQFRGTPVRLTHDTPNLGKIPVPCAEGRVPSFDRCASSIEVPVGWTVVLFGDSEFRGPSRELMASAADLARVDGPCDAGDFNSCLSSLKIVPPPPDLARILENGASVLTREFSVSSRLGWQYSEVDVQTGDTLILAASGWVSFAEGQRVTPDGRDRQPNEPLPEGPCAMLLCGDGMTPRALVGRIGTPDLPDVSSGFLVGRNRRIVAAAGGRLYLGINDHIVRGDRRGLSDGGLGDNRGAFSVSIIRISAGQLTR